MNSHPMSGVSDPTRLALARHIEHVLAEARGPVGASARVRPATGLEQLSGDPSQGRPQARLSSDQLRGRLIELSGQGATATTTTAVGLIGEVQRAGDPAAWVALTDVSFYPPDVAESGIDLQALVVVRVASALVAARAAEHLLRSGAFGAIVLDLGDVSAEANSRASSGELSADPGHRDVSRGGWLSRLAGLVKQHDAMVLVLTTKSAAMPSLGSLVSLRAEALRVHDEGGRFGVRTHAIKDKQRGPGWSSLETVRAPAGLRPRMGSMSMSISRRPGETP